MWKMMSVGTKNLRKAIALNLIVLFVLMAFLRPGFETNDDMAILLFVNGARSTTDPHLVYQNIILGKLYQALYSLTMALPWYTIIQYILLFSSFSGVTWVILERVDNRFGILFSFLFIFFFGIESYISVQYTRTAGIITAAGMLLIYFAAEGERFRRGAFICGELLALFGAWYRVWQFAACALLMSGIGLYLFFVKCGEGLAEVKVRRRRLLLSAAVLLLLCAGSVGADRYSYDKNPLWRDYLVFNEQRTALLDYGFPSYKENRELYERLGITEEAWSLYKSWNFADPDHFTEDVMQELIRSKSKKVWKLSIVFDYLKTVPAAFLKLPVFWMFCGIWVLCLMGRPGKRSLLVLLYSFAFMQLLYLYLFFSGRYLLPRVDVGLFWALCLPAAWFVKAGGRKKWQMTVLLLLSLVIAVPAVNGAFPLRSNTSGWNAKHRRAFEEMAEDKEHLYILKMNTLSARKSYGPWSSMPEKLMNNVLYLGGWVYRTHVFYDTAENWGIENPYRDMIGNENVYLVDNKIELTLRYIQEYYDSGASAVHVKDFGKFGVYQIIKGDLDS